MSYTMCAHMSLIGICMELLYAVLYLLAGITMKYNLLTNGMRHSIRSTIYYVYGYHPVMKIPYTHHSISFPHSFTVYTTIHSCLTRYIV